MKNNQDQMVEFKATLVKRVLKNKPDVNKSVLESLGVKQLMILLETLENDH